jgi:hypothetical protein
MLETDYNCAPLNKSHMEGFTTSQYSQLKLFKNEANKKNKMRL